MTKRLMMSVAAAALIAGSGFAYAQGTGTGREGSSAGSTVQPGAPSAGNSSAATNRDATESTGPSSGMKDSRSEQKTPGAKSQRAQDNMKPGQKSAQENMNGEKSKNMRSESDNAKGTKEMKAEDREGRTGNMKAETREGRDNLKAEDREGRDGNRNAETRSQTTVGQAGVGAKLSTEQRTRITTIIREQHVQPVARVDFDIRPGVRITREGVSLRPLPSDVVTIYPEWRGYEFFLVNNRIVVVDPRTLEIVDVIDV
jgi:hypothetical protein